jgi:hypothetical protein
MLSMLHRDPYKVAMTWAPLSDLIVAGTPNLGIQPAKRALAQSAVLMEGSGIASGH